MKQPMVKALRDLQAYCELILWTYLPRGFVDKLIEKVPELGQIFSYIFTQEDMIEAQTSVGELLTVKNFNPMLLNRSLEEIIIVDTDHERIDAT